MPTNFPTSVDNFTNPTANDSLNLPSHSTQHANANDAIEAVEDYLLNGAGKSGLVLIKTQAVGTGVSTVTVTDAFNATYVNYRIVYTGGVSSTSGNSIFARGASGTGTNVVFSGDYVDTAGGRSGLGSGSATYITVSLTGASLISITLDVTSPFLAAQTGFVANSFAWGSGSGGWNTRTGGADSQTISSTGFTLLPSAGTITGGTIYVYGYRTA